MIFIENKYTKWYYQIITNTAPRIGYTEKHHIIPKSLGGSNCSTNLVSLTPREHYICHWLLTKMVSGTHKRSMLRALLCMSSPTKVQHWRTDKTTSKVYETIKKQLSIELKGRWSGDKNISCSTDMRIRRREQMLTNNPSKGKCWVHNTIEDKLVPKDMIDTFIAEGWTKGRIVTETMRQCGFMNKGRIHSQETKDKVSAAGKGRKHSAETKEKQRLAALRRYSK